MKENEYDRFWQVYITIPVPDDKKYDSRFHRNKTVGIVAPTVQAIITIIEGVYPGAVIWTIQHRGEVHHSFDDFVLEHKDGWIHQQDRPGEKL